MLTKTKLAAAMEIARSSLYYEAKQPSKDQQPKQMIKSVLSDNQSYGHKRITITINKNKKSILRVMNLFNIKPYRRRIKKPRKKADENQPSANIPNLLKDMIIDGPGLAWVADFTYMRFHGIWVYLATVMDIFTKEIVGWSVRTRHDAQLVAEALDLALINNLPPQINHSDQGSEYRSQAHLDKLSQNLIKPSMSKKASPWENGEMEVFYSQFKLDLGDPKQFDGLGELIAGIAWQIGYYNQRRIHSNFRMPPSVFRKQFKLNQTFQRSNLISETVSDKRGA